MSLEVKLIRKLQLPFTEEKFVNKSLTGSYVKLEGATLTEGSFTSGKKNNDWVTYDYDCVNLNSQKPIEQKKQRIGAICWDGTKTSAIGQGACSRHGGVKQWIYGPLNEKEWKNEGLFDKRQSLQKKVFQLFGIEQVKEQKCLQKLLMKSMFTLKSYQALVFKINELWQQNENIYQQNKQLEGQNEELISKIQNLNSENLKLMKSTKTNAQSYNELKNYIFQLQQRLKQIKQFEESRKNSEDPLKIGKKIFHQFENINEGSTQKRQDFLIIQRNILVLISIILSISLIATLIF